MRITIFGATGAVGRRTLAEALSRGHDVTAVVRDCVRLAPAHPEIKIRRGDASDVADVTALSAGQDLVISATRPAPGHEDDLVATAGSLLSGVSVTGVRLLLVGGAAGLTVPGTGGLALVETPDFPPSARPIALACNAQLAACRAAPHADWTYVSPPAFLEPGERTGRYRLGADELLVGVDGRSAISLEDFAVALLDEAEHPRHRRRRFTVGY